MPKAFPMEFCRDVVAVNPAHGVTLPRMPESSRRYLTIPELEELADAAGQHRLLVLVLGYGGLRWGEAAALTVGLEGFVPHELRHTAASLAIAGGANIKVVQTMLGHGSATLTLDRYGHLFGDELDTVAERLDAARAEVLGRFRVHIVSNSAEVISLR